MIELLEICHYITHISGVIYNCAIVMDVSVRSVTIYMYVYIYILILIKKLECAITMGVLYLISEAVRSVTIYINLD